MTETRYPWAPLEEILDRQLGEITRARQIVGPNDVRRGELLGIDKAQVFRWRKSGLTAEMADRCAVRVGLLPYELWPEWLDLTVECVADDCHVRFIPPPTGRGQKQQRYCTRACQVRWNRKRRYHSDPAEKQRRLEASARYKAEVRAIAARRASRSEAA